MQGKTAEHFLHTYPELPDLDEFQVKGIKNTCAQQQDQQCVIPQNLIDVLNN